VTLVVRASIGPQELRNGAVADPFDREEMAGFVIVAGRLGARIGAAAAAASPR